MENNELKGMGTFILDNAETRILRSYHTLRKNIENTINEFRDVKDIMTHDRNLIKFHMEKNPTLKYPNLLGHEARIDDICAKMDALKCNLIEIIEREL